jgi:hypothetical protein
MDYSKWPRKKILPTSLKLDPKNPRLPKQLDDKLMTQPQIISYMLDKENVFDLIKSIAGRGYFINEEPIVYLDEDGKYVVLEGNRRVTACKIILNTDLVKNDRLRKRINSLVESMNSSIGKIEVRVAPSRESADVLLVNRHTDGTTIKKWSKTKQDRFFAIRATDNTSLEELKKKFNLTKSDIALIVRRSNMYQEITQLELSKSEREKVEDENNFAMTNVERFYNSKHGKTFLGIDFNTNGEVKLLIPNSEYYKRLKIVVKEVIDGGLNSRSYNDENMQKMYIDALFEKYKLNHVTPNTNIDSKLNSFPASNEVKSEAQTNSKSEDEITNNNKKPAKPKFQDPDQNSTLLDRNINWTTGNDRINSIITELKILDIKKNFNAVSVLFRSYLDMVVYQYLKSHDAIKEIIKEESAKIHESNSRLEEKVLMLISECGGSQTKIKKYNIQKELKLKQNVSKDWVPSLKHMLVYLSKADNLLSDNKMKQALSSYVKGSGSLLDHNDINLLVHNEYFIKDASDLRKTFKQLKPILDHIHKQLA